MKKLNIKLGSYVPAAGLLLVLGAVGCTINSDDGEDGDDGKDTKGSMDAGSEDGTLDGGGKVTDPAKDGDAGAADPDGDDAGTDPDMAPGDAGMADEPGDAGQLEPGDAGMVEPGEGDGGVATPGFACSSRDPADADIVVDSNIAEDTTWSGTVYLKGDYDVRGTSKLTIEPGTNIIVAVDGGLNVGWNRAASTLLAEGTSAAPITFCGETAEAGYWKSLSIRENVTSNSVLANVLIEGAGAMNNALLLQRGISVENVLVRNSGADGVWAEDFGADSEKLSVTGSEGAPVVLLNSNAVTRFPLGGSLADNGTPLARIRFSRIEEPAVFHDLGIPYFQENMVQIRTDGDTTIEKGVEYRFEADTGILVGWNSNVVTFEVAGTAASKVVFKGNTEEAGFWGGIRLGSNVRSNSFLRHAQIMHGGGGTAFALDVEAVVTLDHVSLSDNGAGVRVEEQGLSADSAALSVTSGTGVPLSLDPNALVSIPAGSTFTGNDTDEIDVDGGAYVASGTVLNPGVPFAVQGPLSLREGSQMILSAGSHFIMKADSAIDVGWNSSSSSISAVGTAAAPIRFSGRDAVAGYWRGISIRKNVLSNALFDYVEIEHAGTATTAALNLYQPFNVEHSTFSDSLGYGILKEDTDATDYTVTNTFTNTAAGEVGDR